MMPRFSFRRGSRFTTCCSLLVLLVSISFGTGDLYAQGPDLRRLFPAGIQRGQSIEVRALGNAPTWPVQVWTESSDIVWEPQPEKGVFRVTATPTSRLGLHRLRFFDADGATSVLRFMVGSIPEANEVEPNDETKTASANPASSLLWNGVLEKRGDVDVFAFDAKAGQTIVASLVGQQQLRAPMDACLQILSSRGNVLAENHDAVGLDPMLAFTAAKDGQYFIRTFAFPEAPDSSIGYSGGDNYVYRLTVTTQGFIRGARPLAISQQQPTPIELLGWNIADSARAQTIPPANGVLPAQWTMEGFANHIDLPVSTNPVVAETPSPENNSQSISIPCSVTGCISGERELDRYRFSAPKDTRLMIRAGSRTLGFPTDVVLRVLDAAGTQLARDDDSNGGIDASLTWQSPADGEYQLEVSDLYGYGGFDYLYRVDVETPVPEVKLRVDSDSFKGAVNAAIEVPVSIERLNGFSSPLKVSVSGLPPTAKCEPVTSAADGDTSKAVKLLITGSEKFSGPITIQAMAVDAPDITQPASSTADFTIQVIWLILRQ
jgi:Bacterial pre-peptidase C-terminal domain